MIIRLLTLGLIGLALTRLLAACAGQPAPLAPSLAPTLPGAAAAPIRTLTPVPTETSRPLPTLAVERTSPPPPLTSPTPDPALSKVRLVGLTWMKGYNLLLSFQFPGPVESDQYRVLLEDKEYPCQKLAKFPDRLYCIGPGVKVLAQATARVYPAGSDQPGYVTKIWIPFFDNDYANSFSDTIDEKMDDPYKLP